MLGQLCRRILAVAIFVAVVVAGCIEPTERLNAPPQGYTERPNELQPFFSRQVDNAMMSDLSITDLHFVPHTSELNSLGTMRLTRMGELIETYGGTVCYATHIQDEELVNQRLTHVREFLESTGIDVTGIDVAVAMAGASYMPADEAIEAKERGMAVRMSGEEGAGESGGSSE